jgi:hypothetical protein
MTIKRRKPPASRTESTNPADHASSSATASGRDSTASRPSRIIRPPFGGHHPRTRRRRAPTHTRHPKRCCRRACFAACQPASSSPTRSSDRACFAAVHHASRSPPRLCASANKKPAGSRRVVEVPVARFLKRKPIRRSSSSSCPSCRRPSERRQRRRRQRRGPWPCRGRRLRPSRPCRRGP